MTGWAGKRGEKDTFRAPEDLGRQGGAVAHHSEVKATTRLYMNASGCCVESERFASQAFDGSIQPLIQRALIKGFSVAWVDIWNPQGRCGAGSLASPRAPLHQATCQNFQSLVADLRHQRELGINARSHLCPTLCSPADASCWSNPPSSRGTPQAWLFELVQGG